MREVIGFTAGLFDLFHVGDLDLLRRARRECDRLIVGVVTDELAAATWGIRPYVPFIERIEILRNVRHVSDAAPLDAWPTARTWAEIGCDVVFTGPGAGGYDVERAPAGSGPDSGPGPRLIRLDGLRATRSPVLRAALDRTMPDQAALDRSSVA